MFNETTLEALMPPDSANQNIQGILFSLKKENSQPYFMEIILLVAWSIWKTRNDFIF
jgi:hypothetical protein